MSPELAAKFSLWRAREAVGQLTDEDMAEIVKAIRQDRIGAAAASEGARRKVAKAAIPNADDLLDGLE
jgi:hypothetical protein